MNKNQRKKLERIVAIVEELVAEDFKGNMYEQVVELYSQKHRGSVTVGSVAGLMRRAGLSVARVASEMHKGLDLPKVADLYDFLGKIKPIEYTITVKNKDDFEDRKHKILMIGDLQAGAQTNAKGYVPMPYELLVERFETLKTKFYDSYQNEPFSKLTVVMLGDLVDGEMIYPNQKTLPIHDQVEKTTQLLYDFFQFISGVEGLEIDVYSVGGNHGRAMKYYQDETNWDNMITWNLNEMYKIHHTYEKKLNLTFHYNIDRLQQFQIGKWWYLIHHGDRDAFPSAYNMNLWLDHIADWKAWKFRDTMDCVLLGHWHKFHQGETHEVQLFVNGTMYDSDFVQTRLGARESIGFLLLTVGDTKPISHTEFLDLR